MTKITRGRYGAKTRWPGALQDLLGNGYEVIEEGLSGRTTDIDDPKKPGRSGKEYLIPSLISHRPLDLVVIMLGTNDLKERFGRSAEEIGEAMRGLVRSINEYGERSAGKPEILILAPAIPDAQVVHEQYRAMVEKAQSVASIYNKVSQEFGCTFIDLNDHIHTSKVDGLHLEPEAQRKIAELVSELAKKI